MAIKNKNLIGFSLVEVLIALVILSIGSLGLAGLQSASLRSSDDAYLRSQATLLAYSLIDRMRANPKGATAGTYDRAFGDAAPTSPECNKSTVSCSPTDLAKWDVKEWLAALHGAHSLPAAQASITTSSIQRGTAVKVALQWTEQRVQSATNATSSTDQTTFTVTSAVYAK